MPCLFCGGGPLTGEHIWSRGFVKKLVIPGGKFVQTRDVGKGHDHVSRSSWQTRDVDIVTNAVCADCNQGWMNRLDLDLEPLLLALARGESVGIGVADAPHLAAWATKLAFMFATGVAELNPDATEAAALRTTLLPPPGFTVWLAYCAEQVPVTWAETIQLRNPDDWNVEGFVATFRVRHLVGQVLRPPGAEAEHWADPRPAATLLWPAVGTVAWPPAERLADEAALAAFSRTYSEW